MKVTHIRIRKADGPLTVMDAFVDKGLTEGGHASLPDIDVDYASDRRQEIKDYLEERYNADGRQRVFSAGTFTTMKLKAALKDVARVHRVPHSIVNYITAMIDDGTDWTGLFRQAAFNRKLRDFIQTYPLVIEDVQGLLGQPKAASIHASAIVVTPDTRDGRPAECFDFLPVRKMDGALVSEFDGYSVDEIGLLKEDVLATKELAKLSAVIALVNRNFGQELTIGRITQDMLDELQETYPDEIAGFGISAYLGSGQIYKNSDKYANVDATGTTKEELEYMKINILRGRNLTKQDMKKEKRVCVVSDTMASYYFGSEDPVGQQIIYSGSDGYSYEFTVVGVYEYNAAIFGKQDTTVPEKDRSTTMYIPATTANKLNHSEATNGYTYISVLLKTGADQNQAETDIQSFFADKYAKNEKWQVTTYNMSSDMGIINTVINVVTVAISFIAAISLIVGGVGVMNIMLVSITERTKEIGIRKALGAKNKAIKQQFLIESVVLCLVGGIIGILIGILFGFILGKVAMLVINSYYSDYAGYIIMNVHPSVLAIILSVCFSMLIGVFFGSYPAKKAAKMEVIDALRYE